MIGWTGGMTETQFYLLLFIIFGLPLLAVVGLTVIIVIAVRARRRKRNLTQAELSAMDSTAKKRLPDWLRFGLTGLAALGMFILLLIVEYTFLFCSILFGSIISLPSWLHPALLGSFLLTTGAGFGASWFASSREWALCGRWACLLFLGLGSILLPLTIGSVIMLVAFLGGSLGDRRRHLDWQAQLRAEDEALAQDEGDKLRPAKGGVLRLPRKGLRNKDGAGESGSAT